ncbi:hypothetical protein BGW36DRAFT_149279 [Talaromyces proteolyticus]|uniref:Uncharacterized protein n=1 Tax=Talaromyces proteolyticus TaxID=1131652 RepID=A0AAD4KSZ8_9EURO|nr:uncharacterized protein BGW36DRAFT_149279 [Talaromyces proteolyticus]KAH8698642.1 hypothetical protein BGW36DRAFT_149279 [Talaromyces proteolyticus]
MMIQVGKIFRKKIFDIVSVRAYGLVGMTSRLQKNIYTGYTMLLLIPFLSQVREGAGFDLQYVHLHFYTIFTREKDVFFILSSLHLPSQFLSGDTSLCAWVKLFQRIVAGMAERLKKRDFKKVNKGNSSFASFALWLVAKIWLSRAINKDKKICTETCDGVYV